MKDVVSVLVICPKCNVPITNTLPGAEVSCYQCGLWVKVPKDRSENQFSALKRKE